MLTVNSNSQKQQRTSFGTNLIVGAGVVDHLNKNPQDLKQIQDFKEYLASDGKNWNAELTYDTFKQPLISEEETEKLITAYAQDYDYDAREKAEKNITRMEPQKASDFIEKMVNNPDTEIGAEAASLAGKIKDEKTAAKLIEKLCQNSNSKIKTRAIYSLLNIENQMLSDESIGKFLQSNDAVVKRTTIECLCRMEDSKHFNKLFKTFNNDSDPKIRQYVLYAIADLKDENYDKNQELYDTLIEKGLQDPDKKVKMAALPSIGKLKDSQRAAKLIKEAILGEFDSWDRGKAAESAGYIKETKLAKDLIEELLQNPDRNIRSGAASAVKHIKDENLQDELTEKVLNQNDTRTKREIPWQINYMKNSKTAFALIEKLINDNDPEIRENAAWHIGWIDDKKLQEKLITKHIQNPDIGIRREIVKVIDRISENQPEKAKEYARIMIKDEDKYIQKEANEILEKIKLDEQKDGYKLKITEGDKKLGERKVKDKESSLLMNLFNSYKAIFEKQ